MPKYKDHFEDIQNKIAQAKDEIPNNISFDPEFHEQESARRLAYTWATDTALMRAAAHASLATSLRLKALMNGES